MFYYQRNFLLLQGIIMRTDVFAPIPPTFNFLDVTTHGDTVQFIYDELLRNHQSDQQLAQQNRHACRRAKQAKPHYQISKFQFGTIRGKSIPE